MTKLNMLRALGSLFFFSGLLQAQNVGSNEEWTAIPVKIDRTNCYYTGQNGVVRSLGVDPNNGNICFAGGMKGGLWKTTDKGQTWSESVIKNLPFVGMINEIIIPQTNSNLVYVACNAGILKSTDGGNSFDYTTINYSASFPSIDYGGDDYRSEYMFMDVSEQDEDILVATDCDPNGLISNIATSTDGGSTWSRYAFGRKNFAIDVKFHPTNHNIIYVLVLNSASNQVEFFRSDDFGQTFNKVTNGFLNFTNPNDKEIRGRLEVTPAQPDLVAYYLNVNDDGAAFYKSTNSGVSFERVCCGGGTSVNKSNNKRDFFGENFSAVQIRWATTLAISDVDPNFVAAGTNVQPRFSMDQMGTWYWDGSQTDINARPKSVLNKDQSCGTEMHGDIQDIVIQGNDVWVANDGGIALSEDKGVTYKEVADGLPITMALGFDMTPGRRDIIVAAMDHNGVMVYDEEIYGDYWKPLGGGDASGASVNPIEDSWLYAIPSGSNIIKRPTQGPSHGHPNYDNTDLEFGSGYKDRFNNMEVHPNQYYTLYAIDYKSYELKKSEDNGRTWTKLKDLQSQSGWSYAEVKIADSNPNVLYLSDQSSGTNKLDRSNDGGQTWQSILPPLSGNDKLRNIVVDDEDENIIWASTNGSIAKIWKSVNGGASWTNYSNGLPDYEIFSMIHQKGSNGGVYVGTEYGVYFRDNSEGSWKMHGTLLPGVGINFLKINYPKGILRAGTERGIWENVLAKESKVLAKGTASSNTAVCSGESIQFAASAAVVFDDGEIEYLWEFEGGTPGTSTLERPEVFYPVAGTFDVKLTVSNKSGSNTIDYNNLISVSGSCVAEEQIALTDITGLGEGPCIGESTPSVVVFNKNLVDIQNYDLKVYKNDQLIQSKSLSQPLLSGEFRTVELDEIDLTDAFKIMVKVENPNGVQDDESDNEIVSFLQSKPVEINNISVVSYNSSTNDGTPDNAVDGDTETYWHNQYWGAAEEFPYEIVYDLNAVYQLNSVDMLNRQSNSNGMLKDVEIYTSLDGVNWSEKNEWTFESSTDWQKAYFNGLTGVRYVKWVVTSTISGNKVASMAELKFNGCDDFITMMGDAGGAFTFKVFPNPTNAFIQVDGLDNDTQIQVVDSRGLLVYQGKSKFVDVSSYSSGTYFVQVIKDNQVVAKKWLKL